MQEYLVCLIPKYSAQNITSNLAICFWNIADYFGILVILQAIFNRILIGIRDFSCSVYCIFTSTSYITTSLVVDGGYLPDPANGFKFGSSFTYNKVLAFDCNPGYKLLGNRKRRC